MQNYNIIVFPGSIRAVPLSEMAQCCLIDAVMSGESVLGLPCEPGACYRGRAHPDIPAESRMPAGRCTRTVTEAGPALESAPGRNLIVHPVQGQMAGQPSRPKRSPALPFPHSSLFISLTSPRFLQGLCSGPRGPRRKHVLTKENVRVIMKD